MAKASFALLIAISLATQLVAAIAMIQALGTTQLSPSIIVWQALSALSAALAFSSAVSVDSKRSRGLAFAHCFIMSLFLPVVGQALFLVLTHHARQGPAAQTGESGQILGLPNFSPELLSRIAYVRSPSGTPAGATSSAGPAQMLTPDQGGPFDAQASSLDRWLEHKDEEIRLMAFGMKTLAEESLSQSIDRTARALSAASGDPEAARLHVRLAHLHWQLIERGLVQPEMEKRVIEACEVHAKKALSLPGQPSLAWFLLGCSANRRGSPEEASTYLAHARRHHFPEVLVLPEMAKAAFHRRDYGAVRQALSPLRSGMPPLSQIGVLEFWNHERDTFSPCG